MLVGQILACYQPRYSPGIARVQVITPLKKPRLYEHKYAHTHIHTHASRSDMSDMWLVWLVSSAARGLCALCAVGASQRGRGTRTLMTPQQRLAAFQLRRAPTG